MWHIMEKKSNRPILINSTSRGFYQSRAAVVRALKTSGVLIELGICWHDIQLVDHWGRSMGDRMSVAVVANHYALRHREGWYWINPGTDRIWYASAASLDAAWAVGETWLRQIENRSRHVNPGRAGFQLVRGGANGDVTVYMCRYQ